MPLRSRHPGFPRGISRGRGQISIGVLVTILVVILVAGFAVTSFQGILNPAEERAAEQTEQIPQRDEDSGGGVDSTDIQASDDFVVCPSSCEAVIDTGDGSQQFSASGNYRLPFLNLHQGDTTTVNSVSNLPAGCAAWLHEDLGELDQEQWYSQDPEGALKVESGQELDSHDAEFAVIAPEEQSCRDQVSNIRYVVRAERNDDWIGGGTFHVHTIFSTMNDDTRDYRITLQNQNCEVEEEWGWNTLTANAWGWMGRTVGDPDSHRHQPFQINIWNREYSEDEPQFTYVGCEPDGSACPADSVIGYGETYCEYGEEGEESGESESYTAEVVQTEFERMGRTDPDQLRYNIVIQNNGQTRNFFLEFYDEEGTYVAQAPAPLGVHQEDALLPAGRTSDELEPPMFQAATWRDSRWFFSEADEDVHLGRFDDGMRIDIYANNDGNPQKVGEWEDPDGSEIPDCQDC